MTNNDRTVIGDRVTIYTRGKKGIWCAEFSRDSQHQRRSLRTTNKKVAMERARKLEVELTDGTFRPPVPKVDLQQTIADYIDFLRTNGRSPKTIVKYRGILGIFAAYLSKNIATKLHQISVLLFDRFRSERKEAWHPRTLYNGSVIVKTFMAWARHRKLIEVDPLLGYKLEKPPLEPKAGPSLAQISIILEKFGGKLATQLAVLAYTGMRSGELQRLRKEDVDLAGNWIRVLSRRGAETKTRRSRKVPIHPCLRPWLEQHVSGSGSWFFQADSSRKFPEGGNVISTKKLNDRFLRLLRKQKLPTGRENGFTIHSLRHSFETICVNAGIPQRAIDTWLGHASDKSMAAVYYRLSDEDSQRFMKQVPFGTGASAAPAEITEVKS